MNIKDIQKDLKQKRISGRLFTFGNLFINEDILPQENQIMQLTGFSGSYALLFITPLKAYLFVDGRYELQAKKEINLRQIEIVKLTETSLLEWLKKNFFAATSSILYNPWTISAEALQQLMASLPKTKFIPLAEAEKCLNSGKVKVFAHQKKFTGCLSKDKISILVQELKKHNLDAYLVTSAANTSWLLNQRSDALPHTPIFRAYTLVEKSGDYKVFAEHCDYSNALPFDKLAQILPHYPRLAADFSAMPAIVRTFAPAIKHFKDPITTLKAIKNPTELKGIRQAHIRDGVALCKFMYWLSKNYKGKTETDIAQKLLSFRKKEINFFSESFATIAAFAKNAAVVHYHATPQSAAVLKKHSLILLDSGAQYYDGTTDVTRTIALGTPSTEMIEKNTLVLKAHIALASAVFPPQTSGDELDLIARQPLLKHGLDFEHGTGHGVGFFSDVHEGPQRISIHAKHSAPLSAGMITSIEPGYYKENAFGIRIENLYTVVALAKSKYLKFEFLTMAPLDKKLINKYLLTAEEITWLNSYHQTVFSNLKKYLTKQELEWLKDACSPL